MNELSPSELISQINLIKERVSGLDNSGSLFYEIWCYIPQSSFDYQLYYKGNNRQNKIYDRFCKELDVILRNKEVAKIKITLKNQRTQMGDMEVTIKQAYGTDTPVLRPIENKSKKNTEIINQKPFDMSQKEQNSQQIDLPKIIGYAFGLGNIEDENDQQFGGLGTILSIRDKIIEDKYEKRFQEEKLQRFIEENAVLKNKIEQKDEEINTLKKSFGQLEEKIDDLEDEISEYERLNPNRDMISGLGGTMIGKAIFKLAENPKFAGLMGLLQSDSENVTTKNEEKSDKEKAIDEITEFLNNLEDDQFLEFYQLLMLLAKNTNYIPACIEFIKNEEK